MDQSEPAHNPSPPPRTEKIGEESWREDHDPKPNAEADGNVRETPEDVRRRFDSGEFDKTIAELEALTADQCARFTDAKSPIIDAEGNRYYLSPQGDLYLYVGPPEPENRFFLCSLKRDSRDSIE